MKVVPSTIRLYIFNDSRPKRENQSLVPVIVSVSGFSLKAAPLLQVRRWLCGDEADQLLHAVVLREEEKQPAILGLAFLQDIILLHQLS